MLIMCLGMSRNCFLRCLVRKNKERMKDLILDGPSMRGLWSPSPSALGSRDFKLRPCFPTHHQEDKVSPPFDPRTETWRRPLLRYRGDHFVCTQSKPKVGVPFKNEKNLKPFKIIN